jgi:glutathione peroxidase
MKILLTIILALAFMTFANFGQKGKTPGETGNIYGFKVDDIRGREVNLEDYKGKVVMIVNTASKCGFTPQYKELQELYDRYSTRGFVILGFPANEFGEQEPGSNEEIAQFCERNFGVTFPMFSKVSVKGPQQHELFRFLTAAENQDFVGEINWNFEKFILDTDGELVRRFRSRTSPTSNEILQTLETLLN